MLQVFCPKARRQMRHELPRDLRWRKEVEVGDGMVGGDGVICFDGDATGVEEDGESNAERSSLQGRNARKLLTVEDICCIDACKRI